MIPFWPFIGADRAAPSGTVCVRVCGRHGRPVMEELPAVIAYEREWNGRTVTVAVNFKKTEQEIPAIHGALSAAGNPTEGTCLLSNEGEPERIGERYLLKAYQAVVFDGKMV